MMEELLKKHCNLSPNNIALKDSEQTITWVELYENIKHLSQKIDYIPNERVAISLSNDVRTITLLITLLINGFDVALLDPEISETDWENIKGKINSDNVCFVSKNHQILKSVNFNQLIDLDMLFKDLKKQKLDNEYNYQNKMKGALLFITSGTTGSPKIVKKTIKSLINEGASHTESFNLSYKDSLLVSIPLYHAFACGAALFSSIYSGAALIVSKVFFPRLITDIIHKEKITILFLIPSLVKLLVNIKMEKRISLSSLKFVIVGTGYPSNQIAKEFSEVFKIGLTGHYGSSETGGVSFCLPKFDSYPTKGLIGKPLASREIKIVDDRGNNLENEKIGKIAVKTDSLFAGYINGNEFLDNRRSLWLTGDIGYRDNTGNFFIVGRESNAFHRNGKKIYPEAIENGLLNSLNNIVELAIVGVTNKDIQDDFIILAIVTDSSKIEESLIRSLFMKKIGKNYIPDKIIHLKSLPKTKNGKINRKKTSEIVFNYLTKNKI
ncbi:hypothetical protein CR203_23405 [Salipaludibacillus neizhouensis]|uniref:AMP-dependent synthetase/ligase domain-containing protein n=1 Tax=Salipaludibacillus neizhouensis TaxID=885475 RepID=A0A3A9K140_9BACI|nr:class I adenylate-forming enzyme family protein [Salipaludibacillus neizhouensis]RKL64958.1 hypothetical protein CR203_23405 [Salipaludibacillus neizhouensis]